MKSFKGTVFALVALVALLGAWWIVRPEEMTPKERKEAEKAAEKPLFPFEKANLVKVEVHRPDGVITLVERADGWWLEGENLRASKSMVNRVKHQLHDLTARATVVDDPDAPALYGLGESAVHVKLTFRDGSTTEFDAGDPNPSGVSFYIRRTGDDTIYTVKKSAVDYYSLSLSEFRERRFASFDSKDVDALEAQLPEGRRLKFQRTGERSWDMLEPRAFAADDGEVRALLGRVSALKAIRFVTDDPSANLATYGLDQPRARITLRFSAREPLTLLLGARTGETDGDYPLAYAKLEGEPTIYAVRDGLLEDYTADPETFRLKRFARMDPNKLASMSATFAGKGEDAELAKTVTVRMEADEWLWDDGVPVPGSTPKRLATRAANVSGEFEAEAATGSAYGLEAPLATIVMADRDGNTRTVVVGAEAPPEKGPEGEARKRYYARVLEFPEVYVIDEGLLDVVKDLMREHRRKAEGDTQKAVRQERITKEMEEKK